MNWRNDRPLFDVVIPIPIRADVTVSIAGLPLDLTPAEAAKIGAVVAAFAEPQDGAKRSAPVVKQPWDEKK